MKLRSRTLLILAFIFLMALSFFACSSLPPFINPTGNGDGDEEARDRYLINVVSAGGLKLDGVRVTASKDGEKVKQGISQNGKVEFSIPLDEYELSFENLPAGYYIDDTLTYVTSATDYVYNAVIYSKVIETPAPSGKVYRVGEVMHDFSITDVDDNLLKLSDLIKDNKAVMLNFWYKDCQPCQAEFPAIEKAYGTYANKLKILALDNRDAKSDIIKFRNEFKLTFNVAFDNRNITNLFGVTAFPTTVIIDRYGVVAMIDSGTEPGESYWKSLFEYYTSPEYVQTPPTDDGGSDNTPEVEQIRPNKQMPASSVIESAINGDGFNATYRADSNEYSWPWLVEEKDGTKYAYASNKRINNSYAILYADFTVNFGDMLSFEYYASTEADYDLFHVIMDDELMFSFSGETDGWEKCDLTIFDREKKVELAFVFMKDLADPEDADENLSFTDEVKIRNLTLSSGLDTDTPLDIRRDCVSGSILNQERYEEYANVALGDDGYYHIVKNDDTLGSIVYASLLTPTNWTKVRYSGQTIWEDTLNNTEYYITPYYMSFWLFGNEGSTNNFVFNGNNYVEVMTESYYMEMFSDNGLLPVDEELKNMLQDFSADFAQRFNKPNNENSYLEFCYYFDHYGNEHGVDKNGDEIHCSVTDDPVKGMAFKNAFVIDADADEVVTGYTGTVNDYRGIQVNRGVRFKFTAPKSGAYSICSLNRNSIVDPMGNLFDANGNLIDGHDEALDYDRFTFGMGGREKYYKGNFQLYFYLEEGETIYPVLGQFMPGATGKYDFELKWLGETANKLLVCTTGEGLWTYTEDTYEMVYIAIDVAYDSVNGYYREVTKYNTLGSPIYIDLEHATFFDNNGNSLIKIAQAGYFNFTSSNDKDYTSTILSLYKQATVGVDKNSELYGMTLATQELVDILNKLVSKHQEEGERAKAWRQMACYYKHLGPNPESYWDAI